MTEKQILMAIFPFYKFSSRMVPHTLQSLWAEPGGKLAQTIRGSISGYDDKNIVPEYIGETMSVPLEETESGAIEYLTGLGLMHEDALSLIGPMARGNIIDTGRELISRSNPILKAPMEMVSGVSFFQRSPMGPRPLEDMDPLMGRMVSNIQDTVTGSRTKRVEPLVSKHFETIMANSPLSRALSTTRTAFDPRKREGMLGTPGLAARLLTGVRTQQVSPQAREAILKESLAAMMRDMDARVFTKRYFPQDVKDKMTLEDLARAEALEAEMKRMAEEAKARAKAQKAG
jgi:hypothetical protein